MSNLTDEQILKLPTPRLLAYYRKCYQHGNNPYVNRHYPEHTDHKKAAKWHTDHDKIKAELDKREHVE